MYVDVHAHLDMFSKDLDQVIKRAKEKGVFSILTSGVNHSTNLKALEISKKYDIVNTSLGLYPIDALAKEVESEGLTRDVQPINVDEELEFIKKNKDKCLAIGEVGLDYAYCEDRFGQKEVFSKVISLVEKINKPIIVHTRKAEKDCVDLLESSRLKKVVLHCFGGNMKLVKRAEDLGFYFSIPSIILRLEHFQTISERVSLNNLLTETDCPYLSPVAGERNEPMNVVLTVKKISEIKNLTEDETKKIIFMNYKRIFS
ncbi:MAG TPA: TatD family hydrolase [Candidatus Nanoarchaeia archaeon]|nr:TatD family hydrolase [Candidatus Nanoarchaeia archaeon]